MVGLVELKVAAAAVAVVLRSWLAVAAAKVRSEAAAVVVGLVVGPVVGLVAEPAVEQPRLAAVAGTTRPGLVVAEQL